MSIHGLMANQNPHNWEPRRLVGWLPLVVMVLAVGVGCTNSEPRVVVVMVGEREKAQSRLGHIFVSQSDISEGLKIILDELSVQLGPMDIEGIVSDYTPLIQQELRRIGSCRINKLKAGGATVDIVVCFQVDRSPESLVIEAYLNGEADPALRTVNRYFVNQW